MASAQFAAHVAGKYSELSPVDEVRRVSAEGGQAALFCRNSSVQDVGPEGFRYAYTFYVRCDGLEGSGAVLLAVDIDEAQNAGACFQVHDPQTVCARLF
eukprot:3701640-Rhodomonas_salina.2